ncbi:MAG: polysaccharide lyase family 7 protein [Epsilonproteobacteria bacterium]|nr:polysaccharide lyase family 7 protein [Campylobacterota bacterium]
MIGFKAFLSLFIIAVLSFAHDSPYSLDKFKDILNKSKLQAPSSPYDPMFGRKYGDFEAYSNKFFYLQDRRYMVFKMCGERNRSELRAKNIWKVSDENEKILQARVKLFPLNSKREFTFLQIHADSTLKDRPTINKPLLRVVWYKKLKGKKGHIWAIVRLNWSKFSHYKKIDLGKMPKTFFDVKITVANNMLKIYINNTKKVDMYVGYWKQYYNYFKAGVYMQDIGCAKVLFDKLIIKD